MKDREFTVILEGLRSDFRAFKEGQDLIWNSINETNRRIDNLTIEVNRRIDILSIETNLRIDNLTTEVREGNKFFQNILSDHEDRFRNHEERIISVEKKIA